MVSKYLLAAAVFLAFNCGNDKYYDGCGPNKGEVANELVRSEYPEGDKAVCFSVDTNGDGFGTYRCKTTNEWWLCSASLNRVTCVKE